MSARVLVAYERSGVVRRAFRSAGFDAWSVDTSASADDSPHHSTGAISDDDGPAGLIDAGAWDLIIAHPPCTYLSVSGLHWRDRQPGRAAKTEAAIATVRWILDTPKRYADRGHKPVRIALENPVGLIGTAIRPADQYVQPYQFGHDASKRTGLWLEGLPPIDVPAPSTWYPGRGVCDACGARESPPAGTVRAYQCRHCVTGWVRVRWANQTDSGQNRLPPSTTRAAQRAQTYTGIAAAMVAAWAPILRSIASDADGFTR